MVKKNRIKKNLTKSLASTKIPSGESHLVPSVSENTAQIYGYMLIGKQEQELTDLKDKMIDLEFRLNTREEQLRSYKSNRFRNLLTPVLFLLVLITSELFGIALNRLNISDGTVLFLLSCFCTTSILLELTLSIDILKIRE
ncbi:MAG: hypothetical protein ACFFD4_39765 [Candidatus Odinarchaeota archaeon]